MTKIVDPDQLNQGTEVVIDAPNKTIQLLGAGNLNDNAPGKTSGVTLQAVYSFLKEEWKSDSNLNKYKFPIKAITETKADMQYGWIWLDDQTRDLLRDGGWRGINNAEYACIITLGSMDDSAVDLGYYQQVAGFDQSVTDFDKTGEVNEPIMIFSGALDYRDFLKVFLREEAKSYALSNLLVDQDLTDLDYTVYRLPLDNEDDIKVTHTDAYIAGNAPYTGMQIDYLVGDLFITWSGNTVYAVDDVIQTSGTGRWYKCTGGHTSTVDDFPADIANWISYSGEREIGTDQWYAFNRLVKGNNGDAEEIYEFCQWQLRQASDINDDLSGDAFGTVNGEVAVVLCGFLGDTLQTNPGVFIDEFDVNDQNRLEFFDITVDGGGLDSEYIPVTSTKRTFPFVAAGNLVFSQNLVDETNADTLYRMYFANANGNLFDTANAIVVNDADGNPIEGQVDATEIGFTFDYDYNDQGGRTPGTNANVVVVAQGLNDSEWIFGEFQITATTGLNFPVNAPDERNYSNPT